MLEQDRKSLYIVDGSYYIYRAYHASPSLSTRLGEPTGGLLLFTNMLRSLQTEFSPDYLVVAFDPMGVKTFRHELFPEYKAQRSADPPELLAQLPSFRPIARGLGLCVIEREGFEADDVMATLARAASGEGLRAVIISGDKDLMQLLDDPHISLVDTMASRKRTYDRQAVIDRFQVGPELVPDALALAGDSSDNIPGVPGIGEKTAGKLLVEFGSLEGILENIDRVSGKKRKENLREHSEKVRLYRTLTEVRTDLDIPFDLEAFTPGKPDADALLPLFDRLEFHRLVDELGLREARQVEVNYEAILTREAFDEVLEKLRASEVFCVDLETTSIDPTRAEIVGVALAWEAHHGVYIPLRHRYLGAPEQLDREAVLAALKPLLEAETPAKVGQHVKYEHMVFERHGITLRGVRHDTMLMSYVLDPGRKSHSLDALATEMLRRSTIRFEEVAGKKGKKQLRFDQVEVERATPYAAEDAEVTLALAEHMAPQLSEALSALHDDVECPLARVLAEMELTGIRVDEGHLRALSEEFLGDMQRVEAKAHALVKKPFNLNSPKQLATILYEDLGLTPTSRRRTTHGYSTNQETLETIVDQHPLPALILEYRGVSKLRSTYAEAIPALIHPETRRVHTSFNQAIAATGRLSSSGPNLQNIPARTEQGRRIRRGFIPRDGWRLLSADYSQIELRLMAHLSQDATMLGAFERGEDIHARTASALFDAPLEAVTKAQRTAAKTINFGVLYGMGTSRLARSLEISYDEAEVIIDSFLTRFEAVHRYFGQLVEVAREEGFATTILGRRRFIPELQSKKPQLRALGERLAINTPVQGTAADLIKLAMIRVHRRLASDDFEAQMLLQVHDELVFEVPLTELPRLAEMVRVEMEGVWALSIPLRVDISTGENWADMSPLTDDGAPGPAPGSPEVVEIAAAPEAAETAPTAAPETALAAAPETALAAAPEAATAAAPEPAEASTEASS